MGTRGWVLAAGIMALVTAACRHVPGFARDPVTEANATVRARIAAMTLPSAPAAMDAPGAHVRVLVRADGIDVDDAALLERARPGSTTPVVAERVVALRGGEVPAEALQGGANSYLITAMNAALGPIDELERAVAERTGGVKTGEIELYAPPDARMSTLYRVIYTAGQRGYSRVHLMMRAAGGALTGYELGLPSRVMTRGRRAEREAAATQRALAALAGATGLGGLGDAGVEPAPDPLEGPLVVDAMVRDAGIEVRVNGLTVDATCLRRPGEIPSGVVTVAAGAGSEGLTRCLDALKHRSTIAERLRDDAEITLVAPGTMRYGEWLGMLVAARGTRPGAADLFPRGAAGVGRE